MKCSHCGYVNSAKARSCDLCQSLLGVTPVESTRVITAEKPQQQEPEVEPPREPSSEESEKKIPPELFQWLEERTLRVSSIQLVVGVITLPIFGLGLMFLFFSWLRRRQLEWLKERGILAPCRMTNGPSIARADAEALRAGQGYIEEYTLLSLLIRPIARKIPIVHTQFTFELEGDTHYGQNWLFSEELLIHEEGGRGWAIVDPKHPAFFAQMVLSERSW